MIILGLTGSIGMGKSTAAAMFTRLGVPVHDSDASVHQLLGPNGAAVAAVAAAFPGVLDQPNNAIDRKKLGAMIFPDPTKKAVLEGILHPMVRQSQADFLHKNRALGVKIAVLDIPLLYETGAESRVDKVIVVTAPPHVQRQRVLARPTMTVDKFNAILAGQMPDADKCKRADYIVQTGLGRVHTMRSLKTIVRNLLQQGPSPHVHHP
ncbi:dephospho-CoA kinase [Micavibrio aeruginosavorus]|uniref:dephospho-CoA kinase n=1 Tax=Micavibrio aeruginosavorus TaxID=349221 RepID=UPI003F4AA77E